VINQIWVDWGHLNVMIGFESGAAGAGVAVDTEGTIYYTLNVRPGVEVGQKKPPTDATANPSPSPAQNLPAAPFITLITYTPNGTGDIIHVVKYGDSLWGIAVSYGATMDLIRGLNGMGSDQVTLYERQKLLIRQAQATSTPTQPELIPASTPTQPAPTATTSPIPNALASLVPNQTVAEKPANLAARNGLILDFGGGALTMGLVVVLFSMVRKQK
jgi:hypothetical protein